MNLYNDTYLPDILNIIAQGLLVPTMAVIVLLLLVTLFFVGQIIVEVVTERRHFHQNMPEIINAIHDAAPEDVTEVVASSGLLKSQKEALTTVATNMSLPEDPLFAMAQTQIAGVEKHYQRRVAFSDVISKIGPMLGLMGTLIPLGPGIVALGQGNTVQLSASLGIAFDATVCGLVCAVTALVISKIRTGWYDEYIGTLEALMTCVLDKAKELGRKAA
ncbi:MAG: MotA/TolQ/ExbB proton channel family protein [Eggerthellaceae bacterium]|nr:MotA/TolQ/ExbB proton channel family protein [Eggerthellaceae bacterium]